MARILIVDDDPQFRRAIHLMLDAHGHEVQEAADGKEALGMVAEGAPDVMVLDRRMPGMDGIETCRALRLESRLPVIMVSASRSSSKEAALAAGANDYLAKPFRDKDLLERIESVLQR
jgi:CheY-like chemotaxis protein